MNTTFNVLTLPTEEDGPAQAYSFDAATPISFVRSSLFGIHDQGKKGNGRGATTYDVNRLTYVANDALQAKLLYTGPSLHQRHMTAWQAVIAAAAEHQITCEGAAPLEISAADLLRRMGASTNGAARKDLEELLRQLTQANVTLETRLYSYSGCLLSEYEVYREVEIINGKKVVLAARLRIRLNPRITHILQNQVVIGTLALKTTLHRDQLAMRLCDLIASHFVVPLMSIGELKDLCGSNLGELKVFRYNVKRAMAKLIEVGLVTSWEIDAFDRLIVKKNKTQVRFLSADRAAARLQETALRASTPPLSAEPTSHTVAPAAVAPVALAPALRSTQNYEQIMEEARKSDPALKGLPKWRQDDILKARMKHVRVAL